MISPDSRLFCRLEQVSRVEQEQQRLQTLEELGLMDSESVPIFEEATQMAARFLDIPICILSFLDPQRQLFKAAVGLSRVGLMNDLAKLRQLPRTESFCTHVVDHAQVLVVNNTLDNPNFADSLLVQRYGIRAYLGVPLYAANGCCLGTLEIMDLAPRSFTSREVEFLELTARWCMSEFERSYLLHQSGAAFPVLPEHPLAADSAVLSRASSPSVRVDLITHMTQELRTPLTSILGMASVINRCIYGPLTEKQKEYMEIIHNSGQYLLSLVNEITELGALDDSDEGLSFSPVDIEMLCQQALNTLSQAAQRREQRIQLTVEPGPRIWLLDKEKVRQMLYNLVFSVIQASSADSTIRIHVSRRQGYLDFTIWTSHPWLGEGLPHVSLLPSVAETTVPVTSEVSDRVALTQVEGAETEFSETEAPKPEKSRQNLGILLSRHLAEMHGGSITVRGSLEEGYRYVIRLPQIKEREG